MDFDLLGPSKAEDLGDFGPYFGLLCFELTEGLLQTAVRLNTRRTRDSSTIFGLLKRQSHAEHAHAGNKAFAIARTFGIACAMHERSY